MNTQSITLDVSKKPAIMPTLRIGQGDKNGTTIQATIYDNGSPLSLSGYSVRFEMRLPDGTSYYQSPNGTISGNVATIPIDETYAGAVDGVTNIAYIVVYSGSVECSTSRVNVIVLESAEEGADAAHAYSSGIIEATNAANAAAASATSAAGTATTAAANADAKAGLADTAATAANSAASTAGAAATNANAAAAAADTAREAIQDDLAAKADKDGYYPLLSAGTSDALLSGDSTAGTFARRVSDHDGACRIESLRGRTVVWNQLVRLVTTANSNNGITYTPGTGNVTVSGIATASSTRNINNITIPIVQGHNYLLKGCPIGGSANGYSMLISGASVSGNPRDVGDGKIFTAPGTGNVNCVIAVGNGTDISSGVEYHPQLFDLTRMFGAGNEPSTVEEFERMYPGSYYPYDAGSLLSVNVEGIESAGVTREIPASTYFPSGMRSAGSVYDELTESKAVTRIGSVDLGTLPWTANASSQSGVYRMVASLTGAKSASGSNTKGNIVCAKYDTVSQDTTWRTDAIGIAIGSSDSAIRVYDPNYNTSESAAAFKTAMSGVMLYYELATPTATAIDPPLNLAYPVEQGGTESIVVPTGEQSAPPTLVTVYAYDADGIVDKSQSIVAPVEGVRASANYGVGSYLVHDGTLYRVTTAIATGEVINPGSNVTATTVMAELIRLTA